MQELFVVCCSVLLLSVTMAGLAATAGGHEVGSHGIPPGNEASNSALLTDVPSCESDPLVCQPFLGAAELRAWTHALR